MPKMQTHLQSAQHQKPKLLDQVRAKIRLKHYSIRTEQAYVDWIKRYIFFHDKRHPLEMGAHEIEQFLNDLAVAKKVSASTQNQALSALIFLYREVLNKEIKWMNNLCNARSRMQCVRQRSQSRQPAIRFAIPSRRICLGMDTTYAQYKIFLAT